jgi:hypothetical protein
MPRALDESVKRRAIEFLAAESKLPFDQVARLYERERAKLELGARVKQYLPIFTFRNVQEQLQQLLRA